MTHSRRATIPGAFPRKTRPAVAALERPVHDVHRRTADEASPRTGSSAARRASIGVSTCCTRPAFMHDDAVAQRHRLGLVVGDVDHGGAELAVQPRDLAPHLRRAAWRRGWRAARRRGRPAAARTIARPSATRWRCPPESWRGRAVEQRRRCPSIAAAASTRCARSRPADACAASARSACSRAPSCAGRARSSGTPSRCRGRAGGTSFTTRPPMSEPAVGDRLEAGDHPQRRALAAPRRPDQHHELAVADLEVDCVHGDRRRLRILCELPRASRAPCATSGAAASERPR